MFFKIVLSAFVCIMMMPMTTSASVIQPNKVYTYKELQKDLIELENAYPNAITVQSIGKTHFNNELWAVKLGNGKKNVLFTGAHHGREWLTTNLLMEMIDMYANAYLTKKMLYGIDSRIIDDVSIWFVPMVNPDGVTIQQNGPHSFPLAYRLLLLEMNKNSLNYKRWKANGVGIDLNRQYPAGWEEINGDSGMNSYRFYKGEKPIEAKEVRSLVQFTKKINPLIAVSYHTSGREIFWKYKNDKKVIERDKAIAEKISKLTGYPLNKPPSNATGGGFTDWFIQTFKRPAYTIEISYLVNETNPPLSVFKEEWQRNKKVGIVIVKEAKNMLSGTEKGQK